MVERSSTGDLTTSLKSRLKVLARTYGATYSIGCYTTNPDGTVTKEVFLDKASRATFTRARGRFVEFHW